MSHQSSDLIVAICAILGILVALIVPYLMRSDAKASMAKTAGAIEEKLSSHGSRLDRAEETIQTHDREIWALKGRKAT